MAARLWQAVLALEMLLALLLALALTRVANFDLRAMPALAALLFLVMQYVLIALARGASTAPAGAHEQPLPASPGVSPRSRALMALGPALAEPLCLVRMMFAMAVEPWTGGPGGERLANVPRGPTRPVLLVHGLACNRAIWNWALPRLRARGFDRVRSVNLQPLSADIEQLAAMLGHEARRLQQECNGERVNIVAHSMGGLIARASLRSLGTEVIAKLVTLATPHHGSPIARALRWPCARQTCPESSWLATLNASQEGCFTVPITSIYTRDDALVPAASAALRGARSCELRSVGHFGLLNSERALACVVKALEAPP
jgi:pimeloyl-ACP methyl ester carboxylesterase